MIRFARLAALAAGLALGSSVLHAELKVGMVNLQKALQETQEFKAEQANIEAIYKPRYDRLQQLDRELVKLQQEYQQNESKYTPQALEELSNNIQRKQIQLKRLQDDYQEGFNRDRTELLQRFGSRMQEVLKKLAEEKGLDMIIDVASLLYYKPANDMSAEATVAYDKAYPVKK